MQPNAKKISNIWSALFFKIAKRFARNLFAPPLSHEHLQGKHKDMNPSSDASRFCHYFPNQHESFLTIHGNAPALYASGILDIKIQSHFQSQHTTVMRMWIVFCLTVFSTYIHIQPIKFCQTTLYDSILLNIAFNHIFHLL